MGSERTRSKRVRRLAIAWPRVSVLKQSGVRVKREWTKAEGRLVDVGEIEASEQERGS